LALVVEMKERGKLLSDNGFIDVKDARILLHQYSEWWDSYSNSITYDEDSTHDDLVDMFIRTRDENAIPMLEERGIPGETGAPLPGIITEHPLMPAFGPPSFQSGRLETLPEPPTFFDPRAERAVAALDFATRWASLRSDGESWTPEDIVDAAQRYEKFLEGVVEDGPS
jgi:hypothetical protein